jgi:hypothetical protein
MDVFGSRFEECKMHQKVPTCSLGACSLKVL